MRPQVTDSAHVFSVMKNLLRVLLQVRLTSQQLLVTHTRRARAPSDWHKPCPAHFLSSVKTQSGQAHSRKGRAPSCPSMPVYTLSPSFESPPCVAPPIARP